jgi:hypothetical protein
MIRTPKDLGVCWADKVWPPEELITEELMLAIKAGKLWCAEVQGDLLRITCWEDRPVIYRIGELDFQTLIFPLTFPD